MESIDYLCKSRLLCHTTVLSASAVAFFLGFQLAKIHPILLPLLPTLAAYPAYIWLVKENRLLEASALILEWALAVTLAMIGATLLYDGALGPLVLKGEPYRAEMFRWVATGKGPEGDISLFLAPKIRELVVFSAAAAATLGFAALLMGAILLDYMNYYVGSLILAAKPGAALQVALLAWPIYAILRVPGYVFLATALTRIVYVAVKEKKVVVEPQSRKLLLYAAVLIALDFVLKSTIANAFYQPLLKSLTQIRV